MKMKEAVKVVLVIVVMLRAGRVFCYDEDNTIQASKLVDQFEEELQPVIRNMTELTWEHLTATTITEEDIREATLKVMALRGRYQDRVMFFLRREQLVRPDVRRRLKLAATGYLQRKDALLLRDILSNMSRYYNAGRICNNLDVEICQTVPGGIIREFAEETDPDVLEEMWRSWHTGLATGLAPNFKSSVSALNDMSRSVGWIDYSEEMMKTYEGYLSKSDMVRLYMDIEPLYKLLHSYVRRKLNLRFPDEVISSDRPLPVTLLGDLFGRFWSILYRDMKPYPYIQEANITSYMSQVPKNKTWLYKWAEERFTSMGLKVNKRYCSVEGDQPILAPPGPRFKTLSSQLEPLPESFFEKSVFEDESEGREMGCQPSAWDMFDDERKDYRIYMCTEVSEEHLQVIIHLMAHVQYFQHFSHQPFFYRMGANEGFQEAIANLFMLIFTSPTHLYAYGFDGITIQERLTKEIQMNYLLHVGLAVLPTLPYLLALDVWRWKVYGGVYAQEEWNCEFWKLRKYYSGVIPTMYRTLEDLDMLPNHQLAHTETASKHFTAVFMMFQILEGLCKEVGHTGPLHTCDLYGVKKAGKKLASAMVLGASQPWPFVYRILTGETRIHSGPLLRYFQPLKEWLTEDGLKAGLDGKLGWGQCFSPMGANGGGSRVVARQWRHVAVATLLYLAVTRLIMP